MLKTLVSNHLAKRKRVEIFFTQDRFQPVAPSTRATQPHLYLAPISTLSAMLNTLVSNHLAKKKRVEIFFIQELFHPVAPSIRATQPHLCLAPISTLLAEHAHSPHFTSLVRKQYSILVSCLPTNKALCRSVQVEQERTNPSGSNVVYAQEKKPMPCVLYFTTQASMTAYSEQSLNFLSLVGYFVISYVRNISLLLTVAPIATLVR